MAEINVTIKPPFRDIHGRFVKADARLIEDRREMVRHLGRRWVELARSEAPEKTGKFKRGIGFKTYVRGTAITLQSYRPEPLGTWITGGTKAHIIRAKHAKALRFYWANGPHGAGMYSFRAVHHPGTKPNPYPARAYPKWKPEAHEQLRRISRNYVQTITGAL